MDRERRIMTRSRRDGHRGTRIYLGGGYDLARRYDRNYSRDYNYDSREIGRGRDYGYDYGRYGREYRGGYGSSYDSTPRGSYDRGEYERTREYSGMYGNTPFYVRGGEMYDYGEKMKLEKEDIDEWIDKLMRELEPDERQELTMDNVVRKAREMGETFEKYTPEELYVCVLMVYTDYKDTIGKNNIASSIALAKQFLCDKDSPIKYGEKLATYYDEIVNA